MKSQCNLRLFAAAADPELFNIYERLGEVVLTPISTDAEVLANPKSFSETQNEVYFRGLVKSSVGVLLGPASNNLYALWFCTAAAQIAFFNRNPAFAKTTLVEILGYIVCFLRIDGFAPSSKKWSDGGWSGAGNCMELRIKDEPTQVKWITNYAPARGEFNELVWPEEAQRLFTPEITYGRPFFRDQRGVDRLNYTFWASYFAWESKIAFSEYTEQFYRSAPEGGPWQELSHLSLENRLLDFLSKKSRDPEYEALACRLDANERKKIIAELRVVALREIPKSVGCVKQFVAECVEIHDGSDVTIKELYIAYGQFCNERKVSVLKERAFQKEIPGFIKACYGASRSNSIRRPDGSPRGFRNLRLKLSVYNASREKNAISENSGDHSEPRACA